MFFFDHCWKQKWINIVSEVSEQVVYSYLANGEQVEQIGYKHSGDLKMFVLRKYDKLNRLTGVENQVNGRVVAGYGYEYNAANQRTRMLLGDQSYWQYGYDKTGQVVSGKRYWSDHELVSGQQYEYAYDGIGNRILVKLGGDRLGQMTRNNDYTANNLNLYSSRIVPGLVDILGEVEDDTEIVRVNYYVTRRKGKYFHVPVYPVYVENWYQGAYFPVTVETSQISETGYVQMPKYTQSFAYDDAGNMTDDGIWTYTWDADNRLVGMARNPAISVPSNVATNIVFTYDWQGRRIRKQTWGTGNTVLMDRRYVYDGWRLMAEYSVVGSQTTDCRSYVWGLDLSSTLDGAGGVGGLLMINDAEHGTQYVCYDGNGNVVALVNAATGAVTARYEYSPFGELIRMTGPMSRRNPFRFSTKYTDDETDLVYYGYRYYSPNLGRWISRDPIGEEGGINLYGFVGNEPLCNFDSQGLANGNPVTLNISGAPYLNYASHSFPWNPQISFPIRQPLSQHFSEEFISWNSTICSKNIYWLVSIYVISDFCIGTLSFIENPISSTILQIGDLGNTGSGFGSGTLSGAMQDIGRLSSVILKAVPARSFCCSRSGLKIDNNALSGISSFEDFEATFIIFNKTHANSLPNPKGVGPGGGRLQSHHGLQQEWAMKNLSIFGYDPKLAPTITIETGLGFPHSIINRHQNFRRDIRVSNGQEKWSSSLQDELNNIVGDFRAAGFNDITIKQVLDQQYRMLEKLGVPFKRLSGI